VSVIAILAFVFLVLNRPAAPVTARQSVSATPSPPSQVAVITSFFRAVRDPNASFSVSITGTVGIDRAGKQTSEALSANLQVHGDDVAGTMEIGGTVDPAFRGSIVRVGQETWVRPASSTAWLRRALPDVAETLNPFSWISTVDELGYVRMEAGIDGHRVHVLETTKWLSGVEFDDLVLSLSDPQRDSRMEVETTDAGVPTHATYTVRIEGQLGTSSARVSLTSTTIYTFSGWGGQFSIEPPT
jgi:hypothetical protein